MEKVLNGILNEILYFLSLAYTHEWFVPFVLLPLMLLVAGGLLHLRAPARGKSVRILRQPGRGASALKSALGDSGDPLKERHSFCSAGFLDLSAIMSREEPGSHALVQAWRRVPGIVSSTKTKTRSTTRAGPGAFFGRVSPRLTYLTFGSEHLLVGVGLILTFLGLIVALGPGGSKGCSGSDVGAGEERAGGPAHHRRRPNGVFTSVGGLPLLDLASGPPNTILAVNRGESATRSAACWSEAYSSYRLSGSRPSSSR